MKSLLKFLAGFFEETAGVSSSKRLIFIGGSLYTMYLVNKLAVSARYTLIELGTFTAMLIAVFAGTYIIKRNQEDK